MKSSKLNRLSTFGLSLLFIIASCFFSSASPLLQESIPPLKVIQLSSGTWLFLFALSAIAFVTFLLFVRLKAVSQKDN
jgi:uncharacterized membrane protein required for colicin V production